LNKDDLKTQSKKLGNINDETPLEKVASYIMSQFARRDIWVQDFEIFEFKKVKLSYKKKMKFMDFIRNKLAFRSIQILRKSNLVFF
jgi:hypothetical protein